MDEIDDVYSIEQEEDGGGLESCSVEPMALGLGLGPGAWKEQDGRTARITLICNGS